MHVESYLPEELHVAVGMMLPASFTNEFFVHLVCCLGVIQISFFSLSLLAGSFYNGVCSMLPCI